MHHRLEQSNIALILEHLSITCIALTFDASYYILNFQLRRQLYFISSLVRPHVRAARAKYWEPCSRASLQAIQSTQYQIPSLLSASRLA
jgi:hypothetical protein